MHFLDIFKKILPLKRYKILGTNYCLKKNLMNYTGIFDLIGLKFWFEKNLRKKLSSKVLF
jgi:hypothetical protein